MEIPNLESGLFRVVWNDILLQGSVFKTTERLRNW